MNEGERRLLEAWAKGCTGVSVRLSKRAWLVLKDREQTDPVLLGEIHGGSRRVNQWIKNYRSMGLVGLMDAPRVGRPATARKRVEQSLSAVSANTDANLLEVVRNLDRRSREVIWRANRMSGDTLDRKRPTFDLDVWAPKEMADLAALFVWNDLVVIASIERSDQFLEGLSGKWLDAPNTKITAGLVGQPFTVINALKLPSCFSERRVSKSDRHKVERRKLSVEPSFPVHVERQLHRCVVSITDLANLAPNRISIWVHASVGSGESLVRFLSLCREHRLWENRREKATSLIKQFSIHVATTFCKKLDLSNSTLMNQKSTSHQTFKSTLQDIKHKVFCWVRNVP